MTKAERILEILEVLIEIEEHMEWSKENRKESTLAVYDKYKNLDTNKS